TFERALPGCIIVNQAGRRYMNEAAAYDISGREMIEADREGAGTTPSYFLFDAKFRARYPIGPLNPGVPDWLHQQGVRQLLKKANTFKELAAAIDVPPASLEDTIRRFNADAVAGRDAEFGRGDTAYDRYYGDPKVKPNPNLAPLDKPPFYAMPIYPGDI